MKNNIGIEINIPPGSKIVKIGLTEEVKEYLNKEVFKGKNQLDYLKEFLLTNHNFEVVNNSLYKDMKDALPENIKSECLYCKGESDDENDKACTKYIIQMQLTFFMAAGEFVKLIFNHKHIYQNKKVLLIVTQDFYKSFLFIKSKGVMYFDLNNMCKCILNAGFMSLSQIFAKSKPLNNLKIINDHIDYFENKQLENQIFEHQDEDYMDLQKKFFENKQRYYKEKLFLEENGLKVTENSKLKKSPKKVISIPMVVLYYYYLQASGDFPYFENHPHGKLKAIDELIVKEKIDTTSKYFQIKYNEISNHKTNRIANKRVGSISYVANQMLINYPKAKEIALRELKEAQTKNR